MVEKIDNYTAIKFICNSIKELQENNSHDGELCSSLRNIAIELWNLRDKGQHPTTSFVDKTTTFRTDVAFRKKLLDNYKSGVYDAQFFLKDIRLQFNDLKFIFPLHWPFDKAFFQNHKEYKNISAVDGKVVVLHDKTQSMVAWRRENKIVSFRIAKHILWCKNPYDAVLARLKFA